MQGAGRGAVASQRPDAHRLRLLRWMLGGHVCYRLDGGEAGVHYFRVQLNGPDQELNVLAFALGCEIVELRPQFLQSFGAHGYSLRG